MSTNIIKQGVTSIHVDVLQGYSVKCSLNMVSAVDSKGFIRWLDNGYTLDNYSNSFSIQCETPKDFEDFLCSDSVDTVAIDTSTNTGFHPFGMIFATGQDYNINIESASNGSEVLLGEVKKYELQAVPAIQSDIYSNLAISTTLTGRVEQHWSIGGVYFPFAKSKNILNKMRFTSQTNGGSTQVVNATRLYGDIAEITVVCSEEQARRILYFLALTMRGTEQPAIYPLGYNIFGRRYDTTTTCKVRLFSNTIEIKHAKLDSVEVSFKLQMTGL